MAFIQKSEVSRMKRKKLLALVLLGGVVSQSDRVALPGELCLNAGDVMWVNGV